MNIIEFGDCRDIMKMWKCLGVKAQTCITSPPYFGLRDYKVEGQIGLEQTPEQYIAGMFDVFRCVLEVLADDGTLWLNIGDSYASVGGASVPQSGEMFEGRTRADVVVCRSNRLGRGEGIKPKDLIGIPWMRAC